MTRTEKMFILGPLALLAVIFVLYFVAEFFQMPPVVKVPLFLLGSFGAFALPFGLAVGIILILMRKFAKR